MARGTSIGSAHVDFSAEGLPELLKGVREAANELNKFKMPDMITAGQVKGLEQWIKGMKNGGAEIKRLQSAIRGGQTEFKLSPQMKGAIRDKQALESLKRYQSQEDKGNAITARRLQDEKAIERALDRQLGLKKQVRDAAQKSSAFLGAGGTLPMRESLLNQRESFEETRGRFTTEGKKDIHRNPVAFMDQMLKSGRASGDIDAGSEHERYLTAIRAQTQVSEGDSEAITRVASTAERQMTDAAGNFGAVRLAQRFQGESGVRQERQANRDMLGVSGQDFAKLQRKQIVSQVGGIGADPDDARPELAQAARDAAEHIAAQTKQAANEYYDRVEAGLQEGLASGRIGDAQFEVGVARQEARRGRDQERTSGRIGRQLSRENVGGMLSEGADKISGAGLSPDEFFSQFAILGQQTYAVLEQQLEDALTGPFDKQRQKLLESSAEIADNQGRKLDPKQQQKLKQDLSRVDRDESRERRKAALSDSFQSELDAVEGGGSTRVNDLEDEISVLERLKKERGSGNAAIQDNIDAQIEFRKSQLPMLQNMQRLDLASKKLTTRMNNLKTTGRGNTKEFKELQKELQDNDNNMQRLSAATGGFNEAAHAASQGQRKVTFMMQQGSYAVQDFVQVIGQTGLSGALRASANNVAQLFATMGTVKGALLSGGVTLLMIGIAEAITLMGKSAKDTSKDLEILIRKLETLVKLREQGRSDSLDILSSRGLSEEFSVSQAEKVTQKAFDKEGLKSKAEGQLDSIILDVSSSGWAAGLNETFSKIMHFTAVIADTAQDQISDFDNIPGLADRANEGLDTFKMHVLNELLVSGKAKAMKTAERLGSTMNPENKQSLTDIANIDKSSLAGKAEIARLLDSLKEIDGDSPELVKFKETLEEISRVTAEAEAASKAFADSIVQLTQRMNDFMSGKTSQIAFGSSVSNLKDAESMAHASFGARTQLKSIDDTLDKGGLSETQIASLTENRNQLQGMIKLYDDSIDKFLSGVGGGINDVNTQKLDKIESDFDKRRQGVDESIKGTTPDDIRRKKAFKDEFTRQEELAKEESIKSSRFKRQSGETMADFRNRISSESAEAAGRLPGSAKDIRRRENIGVNSALAETFKLEADRPGLDALSKSLYNIKSQAFSADAQLEEWANTLSKTPAELAAATAALNNFLAAQKRIAYLNDESARLKFGSEIDSLKSDSTRLDREQDQIQEADIARRKRIEEEDAAGRLTPAEKQKATEEADSQLFDDMLKAGRQDQARKIGENADFQSRLDAADGEVDIDEQRAKIRRDLEAKIAQIQADVDPGNDESVANAEKKIAEEAAIAGVKEASLTDAPVGLTDVGSLHSQIQTSLKGDKQLDAAVEGNRILNLINTGMGQLNANFGNMGKII